MQHDRELQKTILQVLRHRMVDGNWDSVELKSLHKAVGAPIDPVREQCDLLANVDCIEVIRAKNAYIIEEITPAGHTKLDKLESWYPYGWIEETEERLRSTSSLAKTITSIINLLALILGYAIGQLFPWPW